MMWVPHKYFKGLLGFTIRRHFTMAVVARQFSAKPSFLKRLLHQVNGTLNILPLLVELSLTNTVKQYSESTISNEYKFPCRKLCHSSFQQPGAYLENPHSYYYAAHPSPTTSVNSEYSMVLYGSFHEAIQQC